MISFRTWTERPRASSAFWFCLGFCLATAWGIHPWRDLPRVDGPYGDVRLLLGLERSRVPRAVGRAAVLIFGSSRSVYAFVPERLAAGLGLPEEGVQSLAMDGGSPWDALVLLRRNPALAETPKVVILDLEPWHLNGGIGKDPLPRYYNLLTLEESLKQPTWRKTVLATANWAWPVKALRRPVRAWARGFRYGYGEAYDLRESFFVPHWRTKSEAWIRDVMAKLEGSQPRVVAEWSFRNYSYAHWMADSVLDLVKGLRAGGTEVVVHVAPMREEFYRVMNDLPDGPRAYQDYLSFLKQVEGLGARLAFYPRPRDLGMSDEHLIDYGHLNRQGAEVYTDRLVSDLKAAGIDGAQLSSASGTAAEGASW